MRGVILSADLQWVLALPVTMQLILQTPSPKKPAVPKPVQPTPSLADKPTVPIPAEQIPAAAPGPLETDASPVGGCRSTLQQLPECFDLALFTS